MDLSLYFTLGLSRRIVAMAATKASAMPDVRPDPASAPEGSVPPGGHAPQRQLAADQGQGWYSLIRARLVALSATARVGTHHSSASAARSVAAFPRAWTIAWMSRYAMDYEIWLYWWNGTRQGSVTPLMKFPTLHSHAAWVPRRVSTRGGWACWRAAMDGCFRCKCRCRNCSPWQALGHRAALWLLRKSSKLPRVAGSPTW